ncbi:MAG TPA: hypothetical protein VM940_08345 [Chthoniobacterales bacterium]|nr:hypothetical protein [Chthoniobacterales bacterium]
MRSALQIFASLVMGASIALAAVPPQVPLRPVEKVDCCARMHADNACDRQAPKSQHEQECCVACAFGLAVVLNSAQPFIYPPVGDETFADFISSKLSRFDRPPVPPPRA